MVEAYRTPGKRREKSRKAQKDKAGWQKNCRPVLHERKKEKTKTEKETKTEKKRNRKKKKQKKQNKKERKNMKKWKTLLAVLLIGITAALPAQAQKKTKKASTGQTTQQQTGNPKMQFMGKFDAGLPNAGIYKMYDMTDDVVCYILMPDLPVTKRIPEGIMYEGNSIGAISCLKVRVHVVPISGR